MRPGSGCTAGPHSEACRPCCRRRTARPSRPPPAPCRQLIFRFFRCETCAAKSRLRTVTPGRRCRRMPRRARAAPHPRAALRHQKPLRSRDVTTAVLSPLPPRAIPNSRQLAPGGRALAPVPGDCDGRRLARVVAISRQPTGLDPVGNTGRRPGAPASAPPPLCPSPATCLRTCRGRARVARRGPSPADRRFQCSRTSCASNPMRAASPLPFPPSSSPPDGSGCPPFRCTPAAVRHASRALKRLARPVRRPATGGPVYCRPRRQRLPPGRAPSPRRRPSPARTRHPLCAPPARRTPSPLSRPGMPPTRQERGWAPQPPPLRQS